MAVTDKTEPMDDDRDRLYAHAGFVLIGYPTGVPAGNYPLYECSMCGAAVVAPKFHAAWHDKMFDQNDQMP